GRGARGGPGQKPYGELADRDRVRAGGHHAYAETPETLDEARPRALAADGVPRKEPRRKRTLWLCAHHRPVQLPRAAVVGAARGGARRRQLRGALPVGA